MPSCRGIYGSERAWSRFTEILRWQNPLLVRVVWPEYECEALTSAGVECSAYSGHSFRSNMGLVMQ